MADDPIPATSSDVPVRRKRIGRPPAAEKTSAVSTRVPLVLHDQLCAVARQQRTSVSDVVRRVVETALSGRR
jgi:hypothetical protein